MLSDDCTRGGGSPRKVRFAKIPESVQVDARLVGCDLRLLARLIHYAWDSGICWPSIGRLASDLSVAERTIQLALRRLYKLGYVATRSARNPTGREFVLNLNGAQQPTPSPPCPAAPPVPMAVAPESDAVPFSQTQKLDSRTIENRTERKMDRPNPQPTPVPDPPSSISLSTQTEKPTALPQPAALPTQPRRPAPGKSSGPLCENLAAITRALAASGDPIAARELARLERPAAPPPAPPTDLRDMIARLDDDPTFRPGLASALANHWGDRKSYEFYWKVALRESRDVIARAFDACQQANSPPAMFTAMIRRDPQSRLNRSTRA